MPSEADLERLTFCYPNNISEAIKYGRTALELCELLPSENRSQMVATLIERLKILQPPPPRAESISNSVTSDVTTAPALRLR